MKFSKNMSKQNETMIISICEHLIKQYQKILDADKIENVCITFTADGELFNFNDHTLPISLRNDIRSIANDCMKETESYIQELKSKQ